MAPLLYDYSGVGAMMAKRRAQYRKELDTRERVAVLSALGRDKDYIAARTGIAAPSISAKYAMEISHGAQIIEDNLYCGAYRLAVHEDNVRLLQFLLDRSSARAAGDIPGSDPGTRVIIVGAVSPEQEAEMAQRISVSEEDF